MGLPKVVFVLGGPGAGKGKLNIEPDYWRICYIYVKYM